MPEVTTVRLCVSINLIPANTGNFGRTHYRFLSYRRYRRTSYAVIYHALDMPSLAISSKGAIQPLHALEQAWTWS